MQIKIDYEPEVSEEGYREDICLWLEDVIKEIRKGFKVGEGWELLGPDKDDEVDGEVEK